jgi:ribonuclease HI
MTEWLLFTDGSVHTQTKHGYGAALLTTSESHRQTLKQLKSQVQLQEFCATSSTKLELQTLLWALRQVPDDDKALSVYTDSQNILSLLDRRAGFEKNNYLSKKGLQIRNAALYQAFFQAYDTRPFTMIKVKGHKASADRDAIDRIFNLVDKAARAACKQLQNTKKTR